ncbi:ubiquinol-cytochrome c chaperone [Rhodoblastus acidophilus]|uniref:Ubiquinol-cytochrome c chaperone n=1 Tax=Candidatus Rhodoblastus alkanivorans TaxID=2954117 RepID=A0ABS9Z956_9HYPH|nr:ubiquinol-cytochrome C chaperone family protein [Candidatus Rhodoblastus alkanivorans]MCI4679156.1 ubiquinol-cytochrome c chaperone [Candidatus Rhodoblastus alkanivorans]MCI4683152.1 ubiquinol-cytochrome c chaperone [Candidatus Rhodoblastus alkanivorans]MDI4640463.1 ubiquinol-cytochrome c chaperone [Rhodoblastus acidophilus]
MIFGLFRKDPLEDQVARLHRAVISQSRLAAFFLPPYDVADTFEGRFEIVTLNAGLLLGRLSLLPEPGPALAQSLANAIFSGFDDALREVGVSDVGVPKKMKKLARAFMGRGNAYAQASAEGEEALAAALARNVLDGNGDGAPLAAYFLRVRATLDETPLEVFLRGEAPFPPP